jgi:predicted Rossmann-fold nucleotide-binding protein/SAM-dependent methyltransferase
VPDAALPLPSKTDAEQSPAETVQEMPKVESATPTPASLPTTPVQAAAIQVSDPDPEHNGRIIKYITFFGDAAIPENVPEYKLVFETAKLLAENGFGIVDGGGPGVMKAATAGAEEVKGKTVAIYWEPKLASIFEGKNVSNITDESESYSNYMSRTLGLIERGHVYVVCRGGTGTISELGMVWALAKLYFGKHKPVILLGDFWPEMIRDIADKMILDDKELGVLHYAKDKFEVLDLVRMFELEVQTRAKRQYEGDENAFVISSNVQRTREAYNKNAQLYHKEQTRPLVAQAQLDEFMGMVNPPAQVLDLGCGAGFDLGYLAQKYSVTGIDNSREMVEIAQVENPNSEIILGDIISSDLGENKYKGIWARDVLHHISESDLDFVFAKIAKAMVPGGILYTIVREGEGEHLEQETRGGYSLQRFYHYFSEQELTDRAKRAGLELVKTEHNVRSHKWLAGIFKKPEA